MILTFIGQQRKQKGQLGGTLADQEETGTGKKGFPLQVQLSNSCRVDLQGVEGPEKSQIDEPQNIPQLQICSFQSEFIAAFTKQKGSNKDSG